ncbi:hypothetical protein PCC7418_1631 [Halothece sp. PCC 7418]|uniref:type II toxin-antitoxin system HicB family antitoxin n=1 Tax=Halothece sp. (strain PCC 7418) TaxID=65093 RepID=UPI0002A06161|nr:hypothetical protein [Halothece sp. PCC 7418]AFZ43812.1 hypothetical protein PCC7418_1631 [Halothece sp. PCC 7418]
MTNLQYQMVIMWSDEDDCYLVHLPDQRSSAGSVVSRRSTDDFPEQTDRSHGNSYEEAAKNGEEVLKLLLEEDDLTLPNTGSTGSRDHAFPK